MSSKRKVETSEKPIKRVRKTSDDVKPPKVNISQQRLPNEILQKFDQTPGKLLITGCVTWEIARDPNNKNNKKISGTIKPDLHKFHRFTEENYRFVVSGPSSAHTILITMDYKVMTFGQNYCGQSGQPNAGVYETPTLVRGLEDFNIISASTGRHHSLFLTDTGSVYACGENKSGQCGVGKITGNIQTPQLIAYSGPQIMKIGCGADFSVILDIKGNLYTFGLPEYGQLGHSDDGKFFITANKLSYNFETSPRRVRLFIEKDKDGYEKVVEDVEITDFSCGPNHTVAIDSKKRVYSWGFGGYGRLGHNEQKDEWTPRLIKFFETIYRGVRHVKRVFCGSSYTIVLTDTNPEQMYLFGKNKKTDPNMYPKIVSDLCGELSLHSVI